MIYLPIVISSLSLIVAFLTLYNTNLRYPDIHSYVGPLTKLYYPSDGGFAMYIPTTFINSAPRSGTVLRAAILLHRKDSTQEQYFMEWGSFSKYDSQNGNWVYEDICHAIPVAGKSSASKIIWFNWLTSSQPQLVISSGEYLVTLFYWLDGRPVPKTDSHELYISKEVFDALENYRKAGRSTTVEVALDKRLERNRVMTSDEAGKLLKA